MVTFRYENLPDNPSSEQILDTAVNRSALVYMLSVLAPADPNENGLLNSEYLSLVDRSFLRLVFLSDVRARCEEESYMEAGGLAYLDVSRNGLQRVSQAIGGLGGYDKSCFYTRANKAFQHEALDDAWLINGFSRDRFLPPQKSATKIAESELRKSKAITRSLNAWLN